MKIRKERKENENLDIENEVKCKCGDNCCCEEKENNEQKECDCKHNKCECKECDCNCEDGCDCCEDDCECCEDCCDCGEDDCDCCDCGNKSDETAYYIELAQRVQAEFDNYRKRNNDAIKQAEQKGLAKAIEKLLPVVDSITNAKRQIEDETFKKAIDSVYNQIINIFEGLNVKKIDAIGKDFNPNLHNAVLAEEVDGVEEGKILEEYQEGFELDGKVIRYSVVKVSK